MIDAVGSVTSLFNNNSTRSGSKSAASADFSSMLVASAQTAAPATSNSPSSSAAPPTVLGSGLDQLFASPQEEKGFASDLSRRLQAAGVNTSQPIDLTVGSDGHVKAAAGSKDQDKIDAVFAADPALENEYRKIANTELGNAIGKEIAQYMKTNSSGSDAISQFYASKINSIKGVAGELSLSGGTLDAAAADLTA